jgi:ubiquinone/menaquinone biosynthesis C-methylase UbiE
MNRIPEAELMVDERQACAYARADFEEPHSMFIRLCRRVFGESITGIVVDLGCGPADITVRFARAYPQCRIDGIDGSANMLRYGHELIAQYNLNKQINLMHCYLPNKALNPEYYDAAISNSLLHHLQDPLVLWETIRQCTKPHAPVFVMDLLRPADESQARELVMQNAANEPDILRGDFYNSLLAAYSTEEIKEQLEIAGLEHLSISIVSDRHLVVSGQL